MNAHGKNWINTCREIAEECGRSNTPKRAALVAVHSLCVMLDGSGENIGQQYRVYAVNEKGDLEPVNFLYHDLTTKV